MLRILCGILLFIENGLLSDVPENSQEIEDPVLYEGAQIWQAAMRSPEDIVLIRSLLERGAVASMWSLSPNRAEFLVRSEDLPNVRTILNSKGINYTAIIKNVQRRIDAQYTQQSDLWTEQSLRVGHRLNWNKYPSIAIIDEYFRTLTANFPSTTSIKNIGYTSKYKPIQVIQISNGNPTNKGFLITAGLHAREWVTITSALYIADRIISSFDQQPRYIKDLDWYILPLVNPDGFDYSQSKDRFWRKNRRRFGICYGVDINRNFDVDWRIAGVSESNICSEAYSGPKAFSESETEALRKFINTIDNKLIAYVDIHSFGQQILFPWCAKSDETEHSALHRATAAGMAQAIYKENSNTYTHGPAYHLLYPAPGSAIDWVYKLGVNHSYAIETRDKGANGFLLPPSFILETGKEMFQSIKYLASILEPKTKRYRQSWL